MPAFNGEPRSARGITASVRKNFNLVIAGLASVISAVLGMHAWLVARHAGIPPTKPFFLVCLFPVLSVIAFTVYRRLPRTGLIAAWFLLSGTYIVAFLANLANTAKGPWTPADSLRVAGRTAMATRPLWTLAVTAVCLLLDYATPVPLEPSIAPEIDLDSDQ
jgi:hypothetical protein